MENQTIRANYRALIKIFIVPCFSIFNLSSALQASEVTLEILASPAPVNSSLSRVVSDESGQLYLSWLSQDEDVVTLAYAQLSATGWTAPKIISQGSDWFINWADFPVLSVNKGNLTAHWLRMSAEGTYDYDIAARFYNVEQGKWSEAITIHKDGVSAEHGFVSMLPMSAGSTFISWLDGRETRRKDGNGAMTLRGAIFDKSGIMESEWELDNRVCDCCQTSSAMSTAGPIVVYRDRSEDEIRDIYMIRYMDGQWTTPRAIHHDNWQIAGCPVNGPSVAAKNEQVAVSWFTAKGDTPKVQLALSTDSGASFSEPVLVASHHTNGRVGSVILDSGNIVVSWMDTAETESKIMLNRYNAAGKLLDSTEVAVSSASRRSGFPIIEGIGDSVYITWTDISDVPQVKVARVNY